MLRGSMVALVTPMQADLSIDYEALEALIQWHIQSGTHGIVAVGTSGESATLSVGEHVDVIRFTVDKVAGRIPVIAGTGANSTAEAIEWTEAARDVGADACLLVTPYYNKPSQEGLYLHHKAIADAVDIPQLLYNVPGRTAVDLSDEVSARLATHPNIVGIKDATGDIDRLKNLKRQVADDFVFLSGDDATTLDFLSSGGDGCISVTANVLPDQVALLCEAAAASDFEKAERYARALAALNNALFLESNPIPVKWMLAHLGKIQSAIRLPLTSLSPEYHDDLLTAFANAQS